MIWEVLAGQAALMLAALALDAVIGDPPALYRRIPHPVALMGGVISLCEKRFHRVSHSPMRQFLSGATVCVALLLLSVMLGWLLALLCARLPGGALLEVMLASALLASRELHRQVAACASALEEGLQAGRDTLLSLVGRERRFLDESGVSKAAIESLAENFSDAVVAPLFWGVLFGLPGLLTYKCLNTLDSMVGYKAPRYFWFGKCAARLDDAANFIPARLAGGLLCLAALTLSPRQGRAAWRAMRRDAHSHPSPNAGWPEAACAGALGIAIAGPRRSMGGEQSAAWMGEGGRRHLTAADIRAALRPYVRACILCALLLAGMSVFALPGG